MSVISDLERYGMVYHQIGEERKPVYNCFIHQMTITPGESQTLILGSGWPEHFQELIEMFKGNHDTKISCEMDGWLGSIIVQYRDLNNSLPLYEIIYSNLKISLIDLKEMKINITSGRVDINRLEKQ